MFIFYRIRRAFWLSLAFFVGLAGASLFLMSGIAQAQAPQSCPLATGKAYRSPAVATVYLVTSECTKRPFFNPDVYLSFFADWNQVTFVEQSSLDAVPNDVLQFLPWGPRRDFQTGSLVKLTSDPTVYLISGSKAYPIVSEQTFTSLGLSFQQIEDVAAATLAKYPIQSAPIQTPADVPTATVFKYSNSPDIFILEQQDGQLVKAHIETMIVLQEIGRPDRIVVLPPDLTFADTTSVSENTLPQLLMDQGLPATSTDSVAPVVTAFTLPSISSSRVVPVYLFAATDTVGVTGYRITETSSTPSAMSGGWENTATSSYTFAAATGTRTLFAWAKDAAGNVSTNKSATVTFATSTAPDTTSPVVTFFIIPATSTSRIIPVIAFTATDNIGVTGYRVTESTAIPSATSIGWESTATSSYTFGYASGTRTLYAWAKDAAGNVSRYLAQSVVIFPTSSDTVAPTVTAFTIPTTSTSRTIPIYAFTATDNVGVVGYRVTESTTIPSATSSGWFNVATSSYTFSTSTGRQTLYAWVRDAAGNVSRYVAASVMLVAPSANDVTPPVVTAFSIPTTATSRTIPIYTFTATDDVGVTGYLVTDGTSIPSPTVSGWSSVATTSYTFAPTSASGTRMLYSWAKDAAGNVSRYLAASVTFNTTSSSDMTKPVVTSFAIPATSTALSRIVPITSFTATDNVGVIGYLVTEATSTPSLTNGSWVSVATSSYGFSTSTGVHVLSAWAKDAAGNISKSLTATTTLVALPPVISNIVTDVSSTAPAVKIKWDTDALSVGRIEYGLSTAYGNSISTPYVFTTWEDVSITGLASNATYHYHIIARNNAGITATSTDDTFQTNAIATSTGDTTKPVVTSFAIPATSTSRVVPVTSFTATDDVGVTGYLVTETTSTPSLSNFSWSSVATSSYTFSTSTGVRVLSAWAKDAAGNISRSLNATTTFVALPPVISNVVATVSSTAPTVIVTWNADIPSWAYVEYGPTTAYGTKRGSGSATTLQFVTLNNLATTSTLYHYHAISRSEAGVSTTSTDYTFQTNTVATSTGDTTKPVVTSFVIPSASTSRTVPVTSFIATDDIGVTGYLVTEATATPSLSNFSWSSVATSSYTFSTSTGVHVLSAWAKDAAGNISKSLNATTTLTSLPPVISSIAADPSSSTTTATITWLTDQSTNSVIEYGSTTAYGKKVSSTSLTTSHSMVITGLSATSTLYHFHVSSRNAATGLTTTSTDQTFQSADILVKNLWMMAYNYLTQLFS